MIRRDFCFSLCKTTPSVYDALLTVSITVSNQQVTTQNILATTEQTTLCSDHLMKHLATPLYCGSELCTNRKCKQLELCHLSVKFNGNHDCLFLSVVNGILSVMEGSQLLKSIQPHPALTPIMHLLPPNILVSGHDSIPGVVSSTDTGTCRITHNAPARFSLQL